MEEDKTQIGSNAAKLEEIINQERIVEPFSEHEDFLEKDDFGKIISDIKQYAGKQGSRLRHFGGNILNHYRSKK